MGRVPLLSRIVILLIGVVAVAASAVGVASAHSGLAAASPGPGQIVGGDVSSVELFYGDIITAFDATVTNQSTGEILEGAAGMTSEFAGSILLDEPLSEEGEYAIRHTITSFDDDVVEAAYLFSYDASAPPARLIFVEADDDGGLAWWAWTLIGVGGVVLVVLTVRLLLAIRRKNAAT